jgi:pimeloyl-ACP methyl ester carboxylesterase
VNRYSLFVQDHGGPVGFRLALAHPDRLAALVIQNAVAHDVGLGPLWQTRRDFWLTRLQTNPLFDQTSCPSMPPANDTSEQAPTPPTTIQTSGPTSSRVFLGQGDIQMDLFYDYRTNLASYPNWQEWLHSHQPPLLVLWGRYDQSFQVEEAEAYQRRRAGAEIHILDAGHFAIDEQPDAIARLSGSFLLSAEN